jgi:steroid 5-alpha reductase family enzyme
LVLSPNGSIKLGFTTEGRLVVVLIITFSWGFQLGGHIYKTPTSTPHHQQVFWRRCREKEDFCKGSLSLPIFYFVIVLLYFIFACIFLSKIQKN